MKKEVLIDRLLYGYKLNRKEGEGPDRFHFSVGYTFLKLSAFSLKHIFLSPPSIHKGLCVLYMLQTYYEEGIHGS
jgi:hypothetical protein